MDSLIHSFEMLSSHGGRWPPIMQEYLIFVMLGHCVLCGCVAHHNSLYLCLWLFFLNKIKNACVAHIINPQYLLTELCVFMQLPTPGISSWEGDKSSECTFL